MTKKSHLRGRENNSNPNERIVNIQLPVSNEHGLPVLGNFLNEINRRFEIEKNIKNNLYAFIISEGMLQRLKEYQKGRDMASPNGHLNATTLLSMRGPEASN